jgi:hypothetical protein
MIPLTRAQALNQARTELSGFAQRIVDAGFVNADYAFSLGRHWDHRLAALGRLGSDLPVADEIVTTMMVLARELRVPDLDPDAAMRWLDAFPDGVADLFPPSAVTFRLVDEEEQAAAAETPSRASFATAA